MDMCNSWEGVVLHVTHEEFHHINNLDWTAVLLGNGRTVVHGLTIPFWRSEVLVPNHEKVISIKISTSHHIAQWSLSSGREDNDVH